MNPDPPPRDIEASPVAETNIWERLRTHLERLGEIQAGGKDPKGLAERMAERARLLRQRMERPQARGAELTFLAFRKQRERYGIPLEEVAAVEALDNFTPVPGAADFIRGVVPWRGSILSLFDLGRFFGQTESGIADLKACVIVESAGRRIAVVVHDVEEIFCVPRAQLAAVPEFPGEVEPEWVLGIHDENRLILNMSALLKDPRLLNWKNSR